MFPFDDVIMFSLWNDHTAHTLSVIATMHLNLNPSLFIFYGIMAVSGRKLITSSLQVAPFTNMV